MKCQHLLKDKDQDGFFVRTCKNKATHEVVALASVYYPERVYEYLCARHARKVSEVGLAPDVRVRTINA